MYVLAGLLVIFFIMLCIASIVSALVNIVNRQHALLAAVSTLMACVSLGFAIACGTILGSGFWNS